MTAPIYLADHLWRRLVADLIVASGDRADPHATVSEVLSRFIIPASCREDLERLASMPRDPQADHAAALLD